MNTYRVDRADSLATPCGMNSIVYIGDSMRDARKAYDKANVHFNAWNRYDPAYGVILSVWNVSKQQYEVKMSKGL